MIVPSYLSLALKTPSPNATHRHEVCIVLQVEHGYVGLRDVRKAPPKHDDTQQSFFLAETLKYLYLMFGSNDEISIDEWVFNTEAHPLRIVPVKAPATEVIDGASSDSKVPELVRTALIGRAPDLLESLPDVVPERTLAY